MISYAQNGEDVLLRRALRGIERGFYIDVGALSPVEHSVTRHFYDLGWSGINVEPNPTAKPPFLAERPRDVHVEAALSDQPGRLAFHMIPETGLSTLDQDIARGHRASGFEATVIDVAVTTLDAVWDAHVPSGQPVHFLKIDVEGNETRVIAGNDWNRHRPWIVVCEATAPLSQTETFQTWEPMLLQAGYRFAGFDGLNRFYVAQEHAELAERLKLPPNVFDAFERHETVALRARLQRAEQERERLENTLIERTGEVAEVARELQAARAKAVEAQQRLRLDLEDRARRHDETLQQLEQVQVRHAAAASELEAIHRSTTWRAFASARRVKAVLDFAGATTRQHGFMAAIAWAIRHTGGRGWTMVAHRLTPLVPHGRLYLARRPALQRQVRTLFHLAAKTSIGRRVTTHIRRSAGITSVHDPATDPEQTYCFRTDRDHLCPEGQRLHDILATRHMNNRASA